MEAERSRGPFALDDVREDLATQIVRVRIGLDAKTEVCVKGSRRNDFSETKAPA